MRIVELFKQNWMTMHLRARDKWGAIAELSQLLLASGRISSLEEYLEAVRQREELVSTGVGMGIAIPHGRSPAVLLPSIAFGRSRQGIDFEAIDGEPAYLIFLLAVPAAVSDRDYMQTLARLARLLVHESFQMKLMAATSKRQILAAIDKSEVEQESACVERDALADRHPRDQEYGGVV